VGDRTGIEWTDATWNPATGCTKVSPGCDHCYAETIAHRFAGTKAYPDGFAPTLRPERLDQPLRWTRPRRVFVCSMADLFHDAVPDEYIARVFAVMAASPRHTFQVLTKRHARLRALLGSSRFVELVRTTPLVEGGDAVPHVPWPLPNVWVGVSAEDQRWADIRIPVLLDTPAAVRWVSAEPLLGPIDLAAPLRKWAGGQMVRIADHLHWVVTGGESGPGARPLHPGWVREVRDRCHQAGVAFLHKQNGEYLPIEDEPRRGDLWVHGDGHGSTPWAPGTEGAEAGRWALYADVVVRKVGKKAAGRELDGVLHDEYPTDVPATAGRTTEEDA